MSLKRPAPKSAATVWLEGDQLMVNFESHTVKIPLAKCSVECSGFGQPLVRQLGWHSLLSMLREREIHMNQTIGTRGAPVQYDVEQMVKQFKETRKPVTADAVVDAFSDEEVDEYLKSKGLI